MLLEKYMKDYMKQVCSVGTFRILVVRKEEMQKVNW